MFLSSNSKALADLKVGDKAPLFELYNQNKQLIKLQSFLNKKNVVVYFYPKDETGICTKEACSFRDAYTQFIDHNCEVLGISSDSIESHLSFAKNHNLPFQLLSDPDSKVRKLYKVPNTAFMIPGRVTFVIDQNGIIQYIFDSQLDSTKHVENALNKLAQIK